MAALHISPLPADYQSVMGPRYDGEDATRRDELVSRVRAHLPVALGVALVAPFEERRAAALEAARNLAESGDVLQFTDTADGEDGGITDLATVIATLALQPGGVPLLGHHWCTDHALCEAAEEAV